MRVAVAAGVLITALLLTGCTSAPDPRPTTSSTAVQSVEVPDLGPSPAPDVYTPEEVEAARLEKVEEAWRHVLTIYPAAVRPDATFQHYVTEEHRIETYISCYEARGVPIDLGRNTDGEVVGVGYSLETEAQATGQFQCAVEFPSEPRPGPNAAQRGYIYDYLTEFIVPCYKANGVTNPPPPARADFIENWPNQGWFPGTGAEMMGSPEELALLAACPMLP